MIVWRLELTLTGVIAIIVVLAAEVVEIIFDLGGDIFHEPQFDPGANSETAASVGEDLRCSSNTTASSGKKIFCVAHVHPGAASLGIEQPVIGGIAEAPSRGCEPLGLRRKAFLRDGCCSDRTSACASDQGISANRRIGP